MYNQSQEMYAFSGCSYMLLSNLLKEGYAPSYRHKGNRLFEPCQSKFDLMHRATTLISAPIYISGFAAFIFCLGVFGSEPFLLCASKSVLMLGLAIISPFINFIDLLGSCVTTLDMSNDDSMRAPSPNALRG